MPQDYERDEFDDIADQGGPVGVHRTPVPWWGRVLPPILAFIAAGILAYVIAVGIWNSGRSDDADPAVTVTSTPTPSATASAAPSTSPSPTASASPSSTPSVTSSPSETPTPEILTDAQIHVRNASGIAGLAASQQVVLEEDGFTNIEANNIAASLIPGGVNTVIYSEERLADTAQEIADQLGIDTVTEGDTPGGAEIEVLLASDPAAG